MNDWISIDRKMPKSTDLTDLFVVCDVDDLRGADVVNWCPIRGCFVDTYYHEIYDVDEITHWRSLKKPTK